MTKDERLKIDLHEYSLASTAFESTLDDDLAVQYEEFLYRVQPCLKRYRAAMKEMRVRFEILDDSFEDANNRNPIHHIESRLKKPYSIFEKLGRYELPRTIEQMEENIFDVAGVRIIVSYLDDVYTLLNMLQKQDDLAIIQLKDYIVNPKPNGYRSLHFICRVPINFREERINVPVEVQIRTVAMDMWASLEHGLRYKTTVKLDEQDDVDVAEELRVCSDIIEDVECRMQRLMHAQR